MKFVSMVFLTAFPIFLFVFVQIPGLKPKSAELIRPANSVIMTDLCLIGLMALVGFTGLLNTAMIFHTALILIVFGFIVFTVFLGGKNADF